ncbi:MAG: branched-chain amino acid ABC transporter permease [Candidatus Dormibacteraeota bacterium]|nr:branched-chain amino acid ABC transporter permease [Candidatus Dormibacteraeota bacterium]
MSFVLDLLVESSVLLLVVLGLGIILGLMNVVNLAQSGFMAVGVYAALTATNRGFNFWLAVLTGAAAAGVLGLVAERLIIRRLYERPLDTLLATWGISLVLVQLITIFFGHGPQAFGEPFVAAVPVFGIGYPAYRLLIFGAALVILAALFLIVRFTPWGLVARMVMANERLATGLGIDTVRVRQLTFLVGSLLAGFAGALLGPIVGVGPNYATALVAPAFLAVLLAGRTLWGLVLASAILAVATTVFSRYFNPVYATAVTVAVAVILLRLFPEGLSQWRRS